jgi:hypothetical protein
MPTITTNSSQLTSTASGLTAVTSSSNTLAQQRLAAAGLTSTQSTNTPVVTSSSVNLNDTRVRISLPPQSTMLYKDSTNELLSILANTDGVIFPFQPAVAQSYSAQYQNQDLTHSNFSYYFYQNSKMDPITITGQFVVRNPYEGQYVFASIMFLRACTLMSQGTLTTGAINPSAGAPPPVVRLNGMGFAGLDNIPVVITNVTTTYPADVDYVTVQPGLATGETAKIPVEMEISVTMQPVFSRTFATGFSSAGFASGAQRLLGPGV